jgi:prepilin-type N-terminal cleavage/methylation domain-containing protein
MNKKGFTLVEMMVAILVLGMILTVVYRFFFDQEKFLRRERQWSELNMAQRKASTYISKELRNIGFCDRIGSPSGAGQAFGIINGTANSIQYSHDIDGPQFGVVDNPQDVHSIRVSGDTLYIDNDFALDNVVSLVFAYIDTTGDTVTNVTEVDGVGNWILPTGQQPIEHVEYRLRLASSLSQYTDTVDYNGLATLRNKRP